VRTAVVWWLFSPTLRWKRLQSPHGIILNENNVHTTSMYCLCLLNFDLVLKTSGLRFKISCLLGPGKHMRSKLDHELRPLDEKLWSLLSWWGHGAAADAIQTCWTLVDCLSDSCGRVRAAWNLLRLLVHVHK
jgi:hypothetical protein